MKPSRIGTQAVALLLAMLGAGCSPPAETAPDAGLQPVKLVLPERGLYAGAYIEAGDREDDVTLEKIEEFERLVGKHQAIIASSSYWGEQTFPEENVRLIARHRSLPLIYWSPWDRPYVEGRGPDKYSLASILAGTHDAYIDHWADQAKECVTPIIVSFGNEANGSWFPWSGDQNGGAALVPGVTPPAHLGPLTYQRAFRYIVSRVRARGAANVQFVLHLMNFPDPNDTWNLFQDYYPGDDYCDWLGLSLYGSQFPADSEWAPFAPLLDWPYQELCALHPTKPIMLCEWGVAELPRLGDKARWFREGLRLLQDPKYGRVKAIVYWHERWQNSLGENGDNAENAGKYSNLRVNSSPAGLEAYRKGLANSFFRGDLLLSPISLSPPSKAY